MIDELIEEMTQEDRLKAILYQFITLYERWSEDRQIAAKQGADTAQLVNNFIEQVERFKELEPQVRQQIMTSIQNTTSNSVKSISSEIGKEATRTVENTARLLANSVEKTQYTLSAYKQEIITTQWKIILTTALTTIVTCFLVVWLLIPKVTLTGQQIKYINSGQFMELVWPKLTRKEQQHWQYLANQAEHPD